jgi:hypothetical protein
MWKSVQFTFGLAFLALVPIVAVAHHGFAAHFDNNTVIKIEGTVKQFDFVNPHSVLYIDSVNDDGEPVVYVCDLQAKTQLVRRGADETLFTVGDPIVVDGFPARRDPLGCEYGVGHLADGSTFTMRSTDQARTQFAENTRIPLVAGENRSIFGTWLRPGMGGDAGGREGVRRAGEESITAVGQAAVDAFDPIVDNPVIRCEPGSPVRSWTPPGLASSVRQEGDNIIIYHESMDVTRIVHMNMTEHPADIESSDLGHSIGHFEDNVLVIDTAVFNAGVLSGSTLHTDQMTMQERLSIKEDTGDLLITWTVNEPVYYSEPIIGGQSLQSTTKEIIPYECVPGGPISYQ